MSFWAKKIIPKGTFSEMGAKAIYCCLYAMDFPYKALHKEQCFVVIFFQYVAL